MKLQTISYLLYKGLYFVIIGVTVILLGSFFFMNRPLGQYAVTIGRTAITFFWIVSIPGILKRFRVTGILQQLQIILMRSRRRLGILTFLLMSMHVLWVRLFLDIQEGFANFFPSLTRFELMGLVGFCLLIPLFITSNNYSVRLMKNNWGRIHSLIYISMWFMAFHVALQGALLFAIPTFAIAILQATSWIYFLATKPPTIITVPPNQIDKISDH